MGHLILSQVLLMLLLLLCWLVLSSGSVCASGALIKALLAVCWAVSSPFLMQLERIRCNSYLSRTQHFDPKSECSPYSHSVIHHEHCTYHKDDNKEHTVACWTLRLNTVFPRWSFSEPILLTHVCFPCRAAWRSQPLFFEMITHLSSSWDCQCWWNSERIHLFASWSDKI